MFTKLGTQARMTVLLAGTMASCVPAWSDGRVGAGATRTERVCYCDCEAKSGAPACPHMCELPKYENRSWATSCHKKEEAGPEPASSQPGAHSTKNNAIQEARR